MKKDNQNDPDIHLPGDRLPEPERRLPDTHPERCRRCGEPTHGRRRNGYCSDACRMAARREKERESLRALLDLAEKALAEIRREVLR